MATDKRTRIIPDGYCWCGCGAEVPIGRFFLSGHDKRATAHVIAVEYGTVYDFLMAHGYHPDGSKWPGKKRRPT